MRSLGTAGMNRLTLKFVKTSYSYVDKNFSRNLKGFLVAVVLSTSVPHKPPYLVALEVGVTESN